MKHYTLTFQVPDDFDPDKLDITASYPEEELALVNESFLNVEEIVKNLVLEYPKVSNTSVAILKFPKEFMDDLASLQVIVLSLKASLGCEVFSMVNDLEIMIQNSAEAVQMLQRMIDKIKAKSIIKLS